MQLGSDPADWMDGIHKKRARFSARLTAREETGPLNE